MMQIYAFTFTLAQMVEDEAAIDEFYGRTGDVTVVDSEGHTELQFDREAASLEEALGTAWRDVQATGWQVEAVSVEPQSIALAAAGR